MAFEGLLFFSKKQNGKERRGEERRGKGEGKDRARLGGKRKTGEERGQ